VCDSVEEAEQAVRECLVEGRFGAGGERVLIEERLQGPELSMLALCDGRSVLPLAPARDYKRACDGDRGPNTGGMGCISPVPGVDTAMVDEIVETVHRPVIAELERRGTPFRGCLYAGLILAADGPRVIEFNARWGDPETQVLVPRLDGDLLEALALTAAGRVEGARLAASDQACASVVLAARGYPEAPRQGAEIDGVRDAESVEGVTVFHAGTARDRAGRLIVAGGRVLNVTAVGPDLPAARDRAYQAAGRIAFEGMQLRSDIGEAALV
jgi:phosphoribosylamine---glycine ligase